MEHKCKICNELTHCLPIAFLCFAMESYFINHCGCEKHDPVCIDCMFRADFEINSAYKDPKGVYGES